MWACGGILTYAGEYRDITAAPKILASFSPARRLLADKGYDANSLRNSLNSQGTEAVIPSKRNRKRAIQYDKIAYRERNTIERAFCSLKDYRRIATRYDKLLRNFLSAIQIAATILWWT